jgi:hypothetical protein
MRDWWLRTLLVLQRPRPVFVALRDSSKESQDDRAEPILLVVWLAGIAAILLDSGTYLDPSDALDSSRDGGDIVLWAFLGGGIYAFFGYLGFGALLWGGCRLLGSQGSYRRARNVLAFAAVPIALSLVLWPVKLALYGQDWFRTGGGDTGAGGAIFDLLTYAFFLWSAVLLVLGVRAVHGWPWARALGACALALGGAISAGIVLSAL